MSLNIIKKTFDQLSNNELYRILDLRGKVFVMEQRILYLDTDYKDQKSIHYMVFDNEQLISYLRLVEPGYKFKEYAISRVLTDPYHRNKGLATWLIKEAMHDIKGQPIRISGQAYLKAYYEGLGFQVVKGPYMEEDILHYEMVSSNE